MIKVKVFKQSAYPISSPKIKSALREFLKEKGIVSDAEVSVALVGEVKMFDLAQKYLKEKGILHNVLSFPAKEVRGEFKYPVDKTIQLGEIVVCYPKACQEAGEEGVLIEERVIELIKHGALHLLGIHHS
jgi:rRNA maturation RNase YbeY